ncbi:MAG: hypothetical protein ACKV2V_20260 [Blastocatellia bacterium]
MNKSLIQIGLIYGDADAAGLRESLRLKPEHGTTARDAFECLRFLAGRVDDVDIASWGREVSGVIVAALITRQEDADINERMLVEMQRHGLPVIAVAVWGSGAARFCRDLRLPQVLILEEPTQAQLGNALIHAVTEFYNALPASTGAATPPAQIAPRRAGVSALNRGAGAPTRQIGGRQVRDLRNLRSAARTPNKNKTLPITPPADLPAISRPISLPAREPEELPVAQTTPQAIIMETAPEPETIHATVDSLRQLGEELRESPGLSVDDTDREMFGGSNRLFEDLLGASANDAGTQAPEPETAESTRLTLPAQDADEAAPEMLSADVPESVFPQTAAGAVAETIGTVDPEEEPPPAPSPDESAEFIEESITPGPPLPDDGLAFPVEDDEIAPPPFIDGAAAIAARIVELEFAVDQARGLAKRFAAEKDALLTRNRALEAGQAEQQNIHVQETAAHRETTVRLEKELQISRQEVEQLARQLQSAEEAAEFAEARAEDFLQKYSRERRRVAELTREIEEARMEVLDLRSSIEVRDTSANYLQQQVARLERVRHLLIGERDRVQKERDEIRVQLSRMETQLRNIRSEMGASNGVSHQQLTELEKRVAMLTRERDEALAKSHEDELKISEFQSQLQQAASNSLLTESLRTQVDELSGARREINQERERLLQELEHSQRAQAVLQTELRRTLEENRRLQVRLESVEENNGLFALPAAAAPAPTPPRAQAAAAAATARPAIETSDYQQMAIVDDELISSIEGIVMQTILEQA